MTASAADTASASPADARPAAGVSAGVSADLGARADRLEALLPQTQCTKCGFQGCRPYAEAMARGEADCNRCPPGGAEGIRRLAAELGVAPLPLDPSHGTEQPRAVARIDETLCIGCTLCIQACPVDAIVGAGKQMHTVLPDWCTGCDLCVAPCPVDCIAMIPVTGERTGWDAWSQQQADDARARYLSRKQRLVREREENEARLAAKAAAKLEALRQEAASSEAERQAQERKKAIIQAAIERARQKRQAAQPLNAAPADPVDRPEPAPAAGPEHPDHPVPSDTKRPQ